MITDQHQNRIFLPVKGDDSSNLKMFHKNSTTTNAALTQTRIMKKALIETQTLRAGCSKEETNIFAPPQTPFPEARDGQNVISLEMVTMPIFTYKPSLVRIDACTQFRLIVVTDPQTHKHAPPARPLQTYRQDR